MNRGHEPDQNRLALGDSFAENNVPKTTGSSDSIGRVERD